MKSPEIFKKTIVMKKTICLLSLFLFLTASCRRSDPIPKRVHEYPHYDIKLKIDPLSRVIDVEGTLFIADPEDLPGEMFFYLDKGLDIRSFALNKTQDLIQGTTTSDNRFLPAAAKLIMDKDAFSQAETIEIAFSYGGELSELPAYFANTISGEWTEMGLYYPWFPYHPEITLFTYDLEIEIDPSYRVFGMGEVNRSDAGWKIENDTPTNDIVVCASEDMELKQRQIADDVISIYHHDLTDTLLTRMQGDLTSIITNFNGWFGSKSQNITLVESKRRKGGGYARIGGVFLGGFNPDDYLERNEHYHRYFAHELAHLWWFKAGTNSWEDWLNEGFAEYSALMVVREVFGEDAFTARLKTKAESLEGTPPVWGFDRNTSDSASAVLYDKAPLLLSKLEAKIGRARFIALCRVLIDKNMDSTNRFLELLMQSEGQETSDWFAELLRTY